MCDRNYSLTLTPHLNIINKNTMELICALAGLAIGLLAGWLIASRSKTSLLIEAEKTKTSLQGLQEKYANETETLRKEMETRLQRQRQELMAMNEQQKQELRETYEERIEKQERAHKDALVAQDKYNKECIAATENRFDETISKVVAQMNTTADALLKKRQEEFAESSKENIGQIVNPLRETIDKMKAAMNENTLKQTAIGSEMKANIETMIRQSEQARKTADELTRAFKHESKVQGDWGEMVLDELLQAQGLTRGIHYDTQAVIKDNEGNTVHTEAGSILRPDVILHLDSQREVIVDSKVSLTAFFDYVNAETEEERRIRLDEHIMSLRRHVKELSDKDYSAYIKPPKVKMDYVIMFVPHSGALWTALNYKPDLWRKAMEANVFIADEQTLFAALRIINLTWTQIVQAENHEKVYELANEMLNRVGLLWKECTKLGKALNAANDSYEAVKKKISESGKSINTTARQLIKLGAKENDRNPLPQQTTETISIEETLGDKQIEEEQTE